MMNCKFTVLRILVECMRLFFKICCSICSDMKSSRTCLCNTSQLLDTSLQIYSIQPYYIHFIMFVIDLAHVIGIQCISSPFSFTIVSFRHTFPPSTCLLEKRPLLACCLLLTTYSIIQISCVVAIKRFHLPS